MNTKEIHELIKVLNDSNIAEFTLDKDDFSIRIRTKDFYKGKATEVVNIAQPSVVAPVAAQPVAPKQETAKAETKETKPAEKTNYIEFKSPMVGTFYRKPSPDKDVFVKVGDTIKKGDVVCIIEAMKLFNEVESEMSGKIVKVMVDDQSPVEYDQVLFLIDPA
ncbi:MAG: acetyl-CoA carboxylase biotin carboxyl carrier protein [Chitinophagales bacterium]|nr:acetyl-CoA carboxylase biotin carboxyl carrier protein [Chitinophagales bacterium]